MTIGHHVNAVTDSLDWIVLVVEGEGLLADSNLAVSHASSLTT
jgi:hypothetical protein